MRFADIRGQEQALALLGRAVATGRPAHAYLFDGPEGVGKRTAAVGLALALACPVAPAVGCGQCETCRRMLTGQHPDLRVIDAAELPALAKAAGSDAAVDYVRDRVMPIAQTRPHEASARTLVLDHADELTVVMQNAMLKTLEEPTGGVHLVLVSAAPDRLLPTIRSRTQRVRFVPLRVQTVTEALVARGVAPERAELAAALADGSLSRALGLTSGDEDQQLWERATALRQAAQRDDVGAVFDTAAALGSRREPGDGETGRSVKDEVRETLALLARVYRDALAAAGGAPDLVLLQNRQAEIKALAAQGQRHIHLQPLRRALRAVLDTDAALLANANAVTALEALMLELRDLERGVAA